MQNLPPLKQAEVAFGWAVRRRVYCSSGNETLVPPQFALMRGEGNAHEGRCCSSNCSGKLDLDGCMIALPGPSAGSGRVTR